MSIIASAMFFKQHKKLKNGALMIPVRFFLWQECMGYFIWDLFVSEIM